MDFVICYRKVLRFEKVIFLLFYHFVSIKKILIVTSAILIHNPTIVRNHYNRDATVIKILDDILISSAFSFSFLVLIGFQFFLFGPFVCIIRP